MNDSELFKVFLQWEVICDMKSKLRTVINAFKIQTIGSCKLIPQFFLIQRAVQLHENKADSCEEVWVIFSGSYK